jgi:hypothetical protein
MPIKNAKAPSVTLSTLLSVQPNLKRIRPTTDKEKATLLPYSNSRLTDINTCPTYGVVHYERSYASNARALALEAGETMHEVFAMVRIFQLLHVQKLPKHAKAVGLRIFGAERFNTIMRADDANLDLRERLLNLAFETLHTSAWYDDPADRIRTMSNMEISAIGYIDERMSTWDRWPVWVADKKDATQPIGVEQHFDVVLEYEDGKLIRFIGTVDGLIQDVNHDNRLTLDENKTAARLDDAWAASFEIGHQVTGYMACCISVFNVQVFHSRVTGCRIKHTNSGEDIRILYPSRTPDMFMEWGSWVRHSADMHEAYRRSHPESSDMPNFEATPRYTHSCNRFFRACSFLPFCADTPEGRIEQWDNMTETPASPSERSVLGM